jgi:hypothetical protein
VNIDAQGIGGNQRRASPPPRARLCGVWCESLAQASWLLDFNFKREAGKAIKGPVFSISFLNMWDFSLWCSEMCQNAVPLVLGVLA